MTNKTKISTVVAFFASALIAFAILFSTVKPMTVDASMRNRRIFEDNFNTVEIDTSKWIRDEDTATTSNIQMGYGGNNGTLVMKTRESSAVGDIIYFDREISVASDSDLIVEYDLISDEQGYYFSVLVGLDKDAQGKAILSDINTYETVIAQKNNEATFLAYFAGAFRNTVTTTGDGFIDYINAADDNVADKYHCNHYGVGGYNYYTVDFGKDGAGTSAGYPKSFRTAGYTYKHVYLASGGYECFAKPVGGADSEYRLILKTADNYNQDSYHATQSECPDRKIITDRNGFIGFLVQGNPSALSHKEIDNFKVTVSDGLDENTVISESFDRTSPTNVYVPSDYWDFQKTGTLSAKYPSDGLDVLNPKSDDYLYVNSTCMIQNSGIYDDYATLTSVMHIKELQGNKNIGFIFGGRTSSETFDTDGNMFVYFKRNATDNIVVSADIIKNGERVSAGADVLTTIVESATDEITLKITGKIDGKIYVEVYVNDVLDASGYFGLVEYGSGTDVTKLKAQLINRFALIATGDDDADRAVLNIKSIAVDNKWYYHMENAVSKSVAENFDGTDSSGDPYLDESDLFVINKNGGLPADRDAGIYVEDGQLKFIAAGMGGGLAVRHAYDNWQMTFDITDMAREVLYAADGETVIRPVCNAPIIICFAMQAEGLGYTTGKAVTINFTTSTDGEHIVYPPTAGNSGKNTANYEKGIGLPSVHTEIIGLRTVGGTKIKEGFARHQFIDQALSGYTIRMQVEYKDGRLTVGYVVLGLEDYSKLYDPILVYEDVDGEGYVGIATTHSNDYPFSSTFTIDNFRVLDTDSDSTVVTINKQESVTPIKPDDKSDTIEKSSGISLGVAIAIGAGALVLGVAGTFCVFKVFGKRLSKNKRTGINNEKK